VKGFRTFGLTIRHREVASRAIDELRGAGFYRVEAEVETTDRPRSNTTFTGRGGVLYWELSRPLVVDPFWVDGRQAAAEITSISVVAAEAQARKAYRLLDKYQLLDTLCDMKEGVHHAEHWSLPVDGSDGGGIGKA